MHEAMLSLVHPKRRAPRFLDLGCGTGKTSALLLEQFKNGRVVGVDLFDEMLAHASARLRRYSMRVELLRADFRTAPLGADYDACVSALAIHHSTPKEKRAVFRRVHGSLRRGGQFIMVDWTKFESRAVQSAATAEAERFVAETVPKAEIAEAWIRHWREKNIPDSVEDLQKWLRAAGFSSVECVMRHFGLALIYAQKE